MIYIGFLEKAALYLVLVQLCSASEFRRVGIGVYVLNAGSLDVSGGSAYLDYILTLRQDELIYPSYDDAVTANGTNSEDRVCRVVDGGEWEVWRGNASDLFIVNLERFGEVRPLGDGQFRVMGTHFFRTRLSDWPFETQQLEILVELKDQIQSFDFDVVLCNIYEFSGLSSSIRFPGERHLLLTMNHELFERCWPSFSAPGAFCLHQSYISSDCDCKKPPIIYHNQSQHFSCRCQGGQRMSSRYRGMVNFNRPENTAFIKVYLPPLFLVLVTLITYILPVKELSTRLSICGATLISSVFFHVSVLDQLPPTSTLTEADKLMINVYVVNLVAWLVSMVLILFDHSKHISDKSVHSMYSFTRVFLPIVSVCSFALSVYSNTSNWRLWLVIIGGGFAVSCVFLLVQKIVDIYLDRRAGSDPVTDSRLGTRAGLSERLRRRRRKKRVEGQEMEERPRRALVEVVSTDAKYQTFADKDA